MTVSRRLRHQYPCRHNGSTRINHCGKPLSSSGAVVRFADLAAEACVEFEHGSNPFDSRGRRRRPLSPEQAAFQAPFAFRFWPELSQYNGCNLLAGQSRRARGSQGDRAGRAAVQEFGVGRGGLRAGLAARASWRKRPSTGLEMIGDSQATEPITVAAGQCDRKRRGSYAAALLTDSVCPVKAWAWRGRLSPLINSGLASTRPPEESDRRCDAGPSP